MSLFSSLFKGLTGEENEQEEIITERPCANCPSDCAIAGKACDICSPYKKKLIDQLYYVDHIEEFRARYEVTGLAGASGSVTCPVCGAHTENHVICEYCGSRISEAENASGKIRVAAASDIPNPIMLAQDIIWDRYEKVIKEYHPAASESSDSILSEIFSAVTGVDDDSDEVSALGAKMSETEIKEAASLYGVTVSAYLQGLDNGKYFTLAGRKAAEAAGTDKDLAPAAAGASGLAGVGMLAGLLLNGNNSGHDHRPPREPRREEYLQERRKDIGHPQHHDRRQSAKSGDRPDRTGDFRRLGPGGGRGPGDGRRPGGMR